jgi:FtsP/CotA-like multicopper oxidase with cupredoxin domain
MFTKRHSFAVFVLTIVLVSPVALSAETVFEPPPVLPNDNLRAAGTVVDSTLLLDLRAAEGLWRPEGEAGPALRVEAFGADGDALRVPAPLIRVREGTAVVLSVRNDLDQLLTVHGLCARDGQRCAPIEVPPAGTQEVRFLLDRAGTYHYWATTTGMPLVFRGAPDTPLSGALVVDPVQGAPEADRVLVITDWTSLTREQLKTIASADDPGVEFRRINPRLTFLVNGLSWPATERLTYRSGEKVRWRVVNLSSQRHPMHMHGFYYEVDSFGDGLRDTTYAEGHKQRVVTQLLQPGATMGMTWTPEREGNWLFHCHIMQHVSPERRLTETADPHAGHHQGHDASAGMAGLILGVTVLGPGDALASDASGITPRKLTLMMRADSKRGPAPVYGFALTEGSNPSVDEAMSVPGPTLVLRRGEPVEITLVNRLPEGTAIHWHGMELDSYFDGVHGWSGAGSRVTPLIEPGGTFVVRFTPPRTGTFIYHTHLHDNRQLPSGLYGALLVVDPATSGETYDPSTDHVFVIGGGQFAIGRGTTEAAPPLLNGERQPQFVWKAGTRHRVRLINITTDDIFTISLMTSEGPVTWRPLTKDGASLPPDRCVPGPARQTIAVGETYDFEVQTQPGRQNLWLEVRTTGGRWQVQGQVLVK